MSRAVVVREVLVAGDGDTGAQRTCETGRCSDKIIGRSMNPTTNWGAGVRTLAALAFAATPAWAQDAAAAAAAAPVPNKGDTAWMMVSTILVLMMIVPGLALFYGGLVRTKNMLSVQIGRAHV